MPSGLPRLFKWKRTHLLTQELQEMQVLSLGQEDTPEEKMATHSSILAWKISWAEEPGGLQPIGLQRVRCEWVCIHCCLNNNRNHRRSEGPFEGFWIIVFRTVWVFPSGSAVKNMPAMQELQETQVRSLGQEDPLEKGVATHSNILAWRIPWIEEPGGLQSMGSHRDTAEVT